MRSFNEFIQQIKAPDCEAVEGLSIRGWEDELGRLRVWAANIGAHQTNQSSLDFRLRDASHVREQIIKLLYSLNRRLDDAREVLQKADDEDLEVSSDAEEEEEKLDLEPEMLQMQHSAAAIINRLFQMSILVRKPAQVDHRVRSSRAEVAVFEPFDYGHVRDKFPRAEEALISRLGSAITTRRMYLKYRERHAAKLKQGINGVSTGAANEGSVAVLSDTMATNLRDSNIDFDEKASESGESSTSYAATLMSGGAITIPPPPIESQNGNPFECPLCFHIIKIESTKSWTKHVFLDLQPYICLDINCATPQKLYATRRDWLHHMKTFHTEGTGLRIVTDGAIVCPLCAASFNDEMQLAIHSARHLQDLALFVLPQSLHDFEEDDEEEESRPNLEKQAHSSDRYASTPNSLRIQGLGQGSRASSRNSRSPLSDLSVGDKSATKVLASTDDEADVASNKWLDQNDEGEWNHRYPDEIHATSWRYEDNFTSGYRTRWTKIDRKLVSPEALDIGNERYEERSEHVIVLRVLTKDEIESYALKTREIREKRMERLQQLKEKKTLGAKTPLQDASRDNELRYGSQAGQMLAKHGIDPADFSEGQLAAFQSQNPALQERSIQVYLQYLAGNQRKDASLSNAETMSESRSTATPALDHSFEMPPPPQGYSSHNVSSAGNSRDHSSGISKATTEREKEPQRDEEYYYERRTSEVKGDDREDDFYKERHRRRELSPGESVSHVGRQ